ncbi:hypothetical protein H0H92_015578, partial [Tricholoma furcatifolium]
KEKARCAERKRAKDSNKENLELDRLPEAGDDDLSDLPVVDFDTFLSSLGSLADVEDVTSFDARVNVATLFSMALPEHDGDEKLRFVADLCAKKIWEEMKYRFM